MYKASLSTPLLLFFSWSLALPLVAHGQGKGIYGRDNRLEYFEAPAELKTAARSVAALFSSDRLRKEADHYVIQSIQHVSIWGSEYPLCSGENFRQQPFAAFCSAFLIGPDRIATAGHCVVNNCEDIWVAFDYLLDKQNAIPKTLPANNVYHCKKVLQEANAEQGSYDFTILQLDRPVVDRLPLPLRRSGKISDGEKISVIGYPMGWPMKIIAEDATVRDNKSADFFVTDLDSFHGNSGSPVLSIDPSRANSLLVEGILTSGQTDFIATDQGCATTHVCTSQDSEVFGCQGEQATRAEWLPSAVQ